MKRKLLVMLIFVFMLIPAGMARAESPIYLSHTLINYAENADSVTINFVLHVKNPGNAPLYNVTLSYVPLLLMTQGEVLLSIGDIEAGGSLDIPFTLTTPMLLSQDEFLRQIFFWAGEGLDEDGNLLEFPAESRSVPTGGVL